MAGGTRSTLTDEFWRGYCDAAGHQDDDYDVVAFGDGPEMATELADLTVAGIKRVTAGLVRQFGPDGEPPPVVGAISSCLMAPNARARSGAPPRFASDRLTQSTNGLPGMRARACAPVNGGYWPTAGSSGDMLPLKVFGCMTRSRPCSSGLRSFGRAK
jgi:hypothetical protein